MNGRRLVKASRGSSRSKVETSASRLRFGTSGSVRSRVQRLRRLALVSGPVPGGGGALVKHARGNWREDGDKTTRDLRPRPNQHSGFLIWPERVPP